MVNRLVHSKCCNTACYHHTIHDGGGASCHLHIRTNEAFTVPEDTSASTSVAGNQTADLPIEGRPALPLSRSVVTQHSCCLVYVFGSFVERNTFRGESLKYKRSSCGWSIPFSLNTLSFNIYSSTIQSSLKVSTWILNWKVFALLRLHVFKPVLLMFSLKCIFQTNYLVHVLPEKEEVNRWARCDEVCKWGNDSQVLVSAGH